MSSEADAPSKTHGIQPLDAIMIEHGLDNHALVAASAEPLTHKAIQRARKGRHLTPHMRLRVSAALSRAVKSKGVELEREFGPSDLFTYTRARRDAEGED